MRLCPWPARLRVEWVNLRQIWPTSRHDRTSINSKNGTCTGKHRAIFTRSASFAKLTNGHVSLCLFVQVFCWEISPGQAISWDVPKLVLTGLFSIRAQISYKRVHACFLDVAKAFDRVDHNVLELKLCSIGVRGSCLQWFSSYLLERKIRTKVDGILSEAKLISSGVPQGSFLAPLLFIL